MRKHSLAALMVASVALCGCGSMDSLSLGGLHLAGDAPPDAADGLSPLTEDALYLGAVEGLEGQGRFSAALAFLDQYAASEKDLPPRYWLLRGNALLGSGRTADAAAAFTNLEATSLASQGWNGVGRTAAAQEQWAEAADAFQKAVAGDPSSADLLNNLAFAQLHLRRAPQAVSTLRQAQELAPQSSLIRNNLAIALTMQGDQAGMETLLRSVGNAREREQLAAFARKQAQIATSDTEEKS